MREPGVAFTLAQIANIARLLPEVEGVFLVSDDESAPTVRWNVVNGEVHITDDTR